MPSVLIDSREPADLYTQISVEFLAMKGVEVYPRLPLPVGDALIVGQHATYYVERKTTRDLAASLTDQQANGHSRLRNQIEKLSGIARTTDAIPLLVIHGDAPTRSRKGNLAWHVRGQTIVSELNFWSFQMAIASIAVNSPVRVIPLWNASYPQFLTYLMRAANKARHAFANVA
ncbi:MAG: ERCC4 domain-containing protein [bacterium]|jgi:ERCC4-type nuclease